MKTRRIASDDGAIDAAASAWIIRRDAGLSAVDEVEFARWRSADPRHAATFAAHELAWAALDRPRQAGEACFMRREYQARKARRRRRCLGGVAAMLGALAFMAFGRRDRPQPAPAALPAITTATVIVPERQALADGSRVNLRSGAEIVVAFDAQARRVSLRKGEAHFDVAKNPGRPFVVRAGGIEIRAVGTAFSVEFGAREISVLVTEGRVAIAVANEGVVATSDPVHVDAGQRWSMPADPAAAPAAPATVSPPEIDQRLAWRQAHLEFTVTPLSEAVHLLNRYAAAETKTRLALGDPMVATLPVSGYFRADNLDAFVRLLEAGAGIKAKYSGDTITLHSAAR